ncbi:D-tyrosyl-tRNA deacylase [Tilletiaria anomala UBC 951]|uniref:D-aminoacyl-tRNA deacylase n=1 Tax=Tilletiaria anomala (strain ATCC 24038 / CBS 436.72 / UBC 951) TaxID=1037660 RepID=A0A066WIM7_TILAU|nr:D-tyrosyl-tRNA deacylase [Tilletiaria anomala UBC 951]KDN52388.1 D-tyrosyl-tRNA deacylase [Tilletiaria anomala UBC 951]
MRAVLQRVKAASVEVNGRIISRIGPGIVALIGISTEDTAAEISPLVTRVLGAKLWNEGLTAQAILRGEADKLIVANGHGGRVVASILEDANGKLEDPVKQNPADDTQDTALAQNGAHKSGGEELWGGKPWKTNVVALGGEVLCVSQFTLHARMNKGTKPDFHRAMGGQSARELYEQFLASMREAYKCDCIKDGQFGAMMDVSFVNDGPVTIILDTFDKK